MVSTTTTKSEQPLHEEKPASNAGIALASLMTLFFMMGFITCLNDILIPYMKAIFMFFWRILFHVYSFGYAHKPHRL
jgi:FHS family L-fucose permease-like MFS transporter